MEGRSKRIIGRKEVHDMGDPRPHLEVERSKVNVTRSQVKTASVLKQSPQLLVFEASPTASGTTAPPDEQVYKHVRKVSTITLIHSKIFKLVGVPLQK